MGRRKVHSSQPPTLEQSCERQSAPGRYSRAVFNLADWFSVYVEIDCLSHRKSGCAVDTECLQVFVQVRLSPTRIRSSRINY